MKSKKKEQIQTLAAKNGGVMKTSELREFGILSRSIKKMMDSGMIERIKHGHYIWSEETANFSDIGVALKLIPKGVVCLFTAIEHYELSTVNPASICIALPRDINIPILPQAPQIKIYRMTGKHFELGISDAELNGIMIRIFDMEKTVCDCFKYDKEVEKAVALEVLKNYIARGNCNIQKLLEYAKIMGKKKTILPYVEAML
jgi:predicted transcriptional regulator of viral defense system